MHSYQYKNTSPRLSEESRGGVIVVSRERNEVKVPRGHKNNVHLSLR